MAQSVQPPELHLGDKQTSHDLKILLNRIRSVEKKSAVRLVAEGKTLAIYACTVAPETLLDTTPTIMGMRAIQLARPVVIDTVVETSALLDRLARIGTAAYRLRVPPVTVNATWAGVLPPANGWIEQAPVSAMSLHRAAEEGMQAVERALPQNPGHSVVNTVRSRIWSSPIGEVIERQTSLPAGTAFTAVVLGFLPRSFDGQLRRFMVGDWLRINAPAGFVLVKKSRQRTTSKG